MPNDFASPYRRDDPPDHLLDAQRTQVRVEELNFLLVERLRRAADRLAAVRALSEEEGRELALGLRELAAILAHCEYRISYSGSG